MQFHLGDHLGSSNVVVDSGGALVNREEFTPYGETSFGSFAKKRYRFTGKERDEESGLNYHGARYYAAWLARWVSIDPEHSRFPAWSPFSYTFDNPMRFGDPTGRAPQEEAQIGQDILENEKNVKQVGDDLNALEKTYKDIETTKPRRAKMLKGIINQTITEDIIPRINDLKTAGKQLAEDLKKLEATLGRELQFHPEAGDNRSPGSVLERSQELNKSNLEKAQKIIHVPPKAKGRFKNVGLFGRLLQRLKDIIIKPRALLKAAAVGALSALDFISSYQTIAGQETFAGKVKETVGWGGRLIGAWLGVRAGAGRGLWGALLGGVLGGAIGEPAARSAANASAALGFAGSAPAGALDVAKKVIEGDYEGAVKGYVKNLFPILRIGDLF